MSVNTRYQEIFGTFFLGASGAQAHAYPIKSLDTSIPSLASLIGLPQDNLQTVLLRSGFASVRKNGQFIFSSDKFQAFLNENKLDNICKVIQRKPKEFQNQQWYVRDGSLYRGDALVPGTKGIEPIIRNIQDFDETSAIGETSPKMVEKARKKLAVLSNILQGSIAWLSTSRIPSLQWWERPFTQCNATQQPTIFDPTRPCDLILY